MSGVAAVAEQPTAGDTRPLPRTQATMAGLITAGLVSYASGTARWFKGTGPDDIAVKGDGRALREMRTAGLIRVDESAQPDERGAYPVELTSAGQARYRPR